MRIRVYPEAVIAAVIASVVAAVLLFKTFDGNITGFFRIGDVLPVSPFLNPDRVRQVHGEVGYDGQQFLTLALDPMLRHPGTLAALDNPPYRYRRIGFPLIGYGIGIGNPALIPFALVLVNLMAIAILTCWVARYRAGADDAGNRSPGRPALWVLACPGIWVGFCLTTADLLGCAWLLTGLLALRHQRLICATIALSAACLTRETYLATVLALLAWHLYARRDKKTLFALGAAMLPALGWMVHVYARIPGGTSGIHENLSIPFAGIIAKIGRIVSGGTGSHALFEATAFMTLLAVAALGLAVVLRDRRDLTSAHIGILAALAILAISKMQILVYHANYLRIFLDVWILLLLVPEGSRGFRRIRAGVLALSALVSLAYVGNYMFS